MKRLSRSDSGAVAIFVALAATVIFATSAIAVDLGNAMARQRQSQAQADLAALAGAGANGSDLPAPVHTAVCSGGIKQASPTDPSVIDVATYVLDNWPQDDSGNALPSLSQLETNLTDCDQSNGEVMYGSWSNSGTWTADRNKVTVVSPGAQVNFGLARAIGYSKETVRAVATAAIGTPLYSTLPFYAFTGCDYGQQTIANPTNGQASGTPTLDSPNDNNAATLTSLATVPATGSIAVAVGDTTSKLVLTGTNLTNVTAVGFFESGNASTGPPPTVVGGSGFTIDSATQITIKAPLPSAVTSVEDLWYVRVKIGSSWSAVTFGNGNGTTNTPSVNVGTPTLQCGQGSSAGNFGTLQLSNTQASGQWQQIAQNIATGLQSTLGPYPSPASPFTCDPNMPPAIGWPTAGTNCVDTKTGLDSDAATSGFITAQGIVAPRGLLANVQTGTGCAANGVPATTVRIPGVLINNDPLSCFLTRPGVNIGQIDNPTYNLSGPVLSQQIWNSPRFVKVPVLGTQPTSGGSNNYEIVGFRYGYITDQPPSSTQTSTATSNNGIVLSSNGNDIQSVQIDFLNDQAVPSPPLNKVKGTIAYIGSGTKVVTLVR